MFANKIKKHIPCFYRLEGHEGKFGSEMLRMLQEYEPKGKSFQSSFEFS